jgi:hypothetical protein
LKFTNIPSYQLIVRKHRNLPKTITFEFSK